MKRSKRRIKKELKKPLINKKILNRIIKEDNLCQHAIRELKLAGYKPGNDVPNSWMYNQVLEAVAVFASHNNSGFSANYEINLVRKLCDFKVISPLRFTDDEWHPLCYNSYQNKRDSSIFKKLDGRIHPLYAFNLKPIKTYYFDNKTWENTEGNCCWCGGAFECEEGVFTGKYIGRCFIKESDVKNGFIPKETITIPCVEIEFAKDDWVLAVDTDESKLAELDNQYDVDFIECPVVKGVKLEDLTKELYKQSVELIKKSKSYE